MNEPRASAPRPAPTGAARLPVPVSPTGEQYELLLDTEGQSGARHRLRAVIVEVAAALRHLSVDGVEIAGGYPAGVPSPGASGIVLVPWPNRIRDGRWQLDGSTQQLDITEPPYANASHGLLRNTPYRLVEKTPTAVVLSAAIFPQHGYPFSLETSVRYELVAEGLVVTHTVVNVGASAAPVVIGAHPYFFLGELSSEELVLTVSGATRVEVDEQLIPVGATPVEGTDLDLREGRPVRGLEVNAAYTDLSFSDGVSEHSLRSTDGRSVTMWADEAHGYVQAFITRDFPDFRGAEGEALASPPVARGVRTAVALEPMTGPADAFNSGEGLSWLAPATEWSVTWGVRFEGFPSGGQE